MYLSLKHLAKKYDLHQDTIRKKLSNLVQGKHFIRIGKSLRFHEEEMHKFLTDSSQNYQSNIDIDSIMNNILN